MINTCITNIGSGRFKKRSAVCGLSPSPRLRRTCQSAVSSTIPHSAFRIPHSQGFTLLELMTVMVIMFILMGMSSLALRGIMRGAGISGAVANVRSVLTQARQHAIMQQRPTAVFFYSAGATNTMQILTSYGRVTSGSSAMFVPEVELSWPVEELEGATVYNFRGDTGSFTGGTGMGGDAYVTRDITWLAADDVAFPVGAVRALPDGIKFAGLPAPPIVVFEADGSARDALDIELQEISAASGTPGIAISVAETTGWITVDEPGE